MVYPSLSSSRRAFLTQMGGGLSGLALSSLLQEESRGAALWTPPTGEPHRSPKAKNVIWLFMRGGLSHLESFDPKPMVNRYAGKTIGETPFSHVQSPDKLKDVRVVVINDANGHQRNELYPLQTGFQRYGQSGIEVSDWFPHIGGCV